MITIIPRVFQLGTVYITECLRKYSCLLDVYCPIFIFKISKRFAGRHSPIIEGTTGLENVSCTATFIDSQFKMVMNVIESICIFCIGKECILFVLKWDRKILLGTRIT